MINKRLLCAKIIEHGDTQKSLASDMGLSGSWFNKKLHGKKADFKRSEIEFIARRYNFSPEVLNRIFFADEVA